MYHLKNKLSKSKQRSQKKQNNYPTNNRGLPKGHTIRGNQAYPRNKDCPCGSGLKYKHCGLKELCI